MPYQTPFHTRVSPLCTSQEWRNWSGFLSPVTYQPHHEAEYYAIRNSAALIDISPLFKYEFSGSQAALAVDRIMTRDIGKCQIGQVLYSPWCDENGKVIDDGTVSRLSMDRFRITAADPNLRWFQDCAFGLDVDIRDVSDDLAALALQGPKSLPILKAISDHPHQIAGLNYFHLLETQLGDIPLTITRTGYTGDLGYELWVEPRHALPLWDLLVDVGNTFGLLPCGLAALDIARIEAGLLLIGVDYISSNSAILESQKSSPFEIGLGWTVKFGQVDFIGRSILESEAIAGSPWQFVGFEIDWLSMESVYGKVGLPPQVSGRAKREPHPIYSQGRQIGQATSVTFSPILKKYIAIGTVEAAHAIEGNELEIEVTVEYSRARAKATVTELPFYNPGHKRRLAE